MVHLPVATEQRGQGGHLPPIKSYGGSAHPHNLRAHKNLQGTQNQSEIIKSKKKKMSTKGRGRKIDYHSQEWAGLSKK